MQVWNSARSFQKPWEIMESWHECCEALWVRWAFKGSSSRHAKFKIKDVPRQAGNSMGAKIRQSKTWHNIEIWMLGSKSMWHVMPSCNSMAALRHKKTRSLRIPCVPWGIQNPKIPWVPWGNFNIRAKSCNGRIQWLPLRHEKHCNNTICLLPGGIQRLCCLGIQ